MYRINDKQKNLTQREKTIVEHLAQGKKSIQISNELIVDNCRNHRTVKRFIADSNKATRRGDKGVCRNVEAY